METNMKFLQFTPAAAEKLSTDFVVSPDGSVVDVRPSTDDEPVLDVILDAFEGHLAQQTADLLGAFDEAIEEVVASVPAAYRDAVVRRALAISLSGICEDTGRDPAVEIGLADDLYTTLDLADLTV